MVDPIFNGKLTDSEFVIERIHAKKTLALAPFEVASAMMPLALPSQPLVRRPHESGAGPRLGKYLIYTAVPPHFLGCFVLVSGRFYRAIRLNGAGCFGEGVYTFEPGSRSITWVSGPFKNKGCGGRFEIQDCGKMHRVELNSSTFGYNYGA